MLAQGAAVVGAGCGPAAAATAGRSSGCASVCEQQKQPCLAWARAAAEADGVLDSTVSEWRFPCSSSSSSSSSFWQPGHAVILDQQRYAQTTAVYL
jgi:hypothetical protein